jgi:WD40 repeat protein
MPQSVFISYSRANDEFARRLYNQLATLDFKLWRDRSEMEAGEAWWEQIQEAIRSVETMVLVLSPQALDSPIVAKEWRYARQVGTRVIPIIAADIDFKTIPRWVGKLDILDFRDGAPERDLIWEKFVSQLNNPYQRRRVPFTAPDLPERFVPRPAEFNKMIKLLLDSTYENPVAVTVAFKGGGGFGKTVMAQAICHDERIQAAFDGGILWITIGEQPNLVGLITDQIMLLTGEQPTFSDANTATARLKELLAERDMLLVLDDIWDESHARPFMQGGMNCARLLTTRRQDVATRLGAQLVDVNQMKIGEAALMLIGWLDQPPTDVAPFEALAHELGEWPLLLRLASAYLHESVTIDQQSVDEALSGLRKRLARKGFTAFDRTDERQRNRAISISLEVSISRLQHWRERYLELAVFPEDVLIPFAAIERLWQATGDLDDLDTEDALKAIQRLSLLDVYDPLGKTIRLHDVVRGYLAQQQKDRLPDLHAQMLDAYQLTRWALLPAENRYLWRYLAYHLIEAKRQDELVTTVLGLYYLATKAFLESPYAAQTDLMIAEKQAPENTALRTLRRNFANMSHLLNKSKTINDVAATLHSRLQHLTELAENCRVLAGQLTKPYLTAWHPLPDLPHPSLIRTLSGHSNGVSGCAISPAGDFIVSVSYDHSIKIWESQTGAERLTLRGHTGELTSCAVSPAGDWIVSASKHGTLKVWDTETGQEKLSLRGHNGAVSKCAVSPAGDFIVSASVDMTLKVWDSVTGEERFTLRGHKSRVNDCAVSDQFIVSASSDHTVKVWDAQTGIECRTLEGHSRRVNAVSLAGDTIVSGALDNTLKIWDAQTGAERFTLAGHSGEVTDCVISASGDLIVSAAWDGAIKVWDAQTGTERLTLMGHTHRVNSCAISASGDLIVSASNDGTLRVWDGQTISLASRLQLGSLMSGGHKGEVRDCAINTEGDWAVSISNDGQLKVWDTETGAEQMTFGESQSRLSCCAISPDDSFIVCGVDNVLKVWDTETGQERLILSSLTPSEMNGCAISPTGDRIVGASSDNLLRVWDSKTGDHLLTLEGHSEGVDACAVSPDGDWIVSASYDTTLKIWDAKTGIERRTLRGHADVVHNCAISPNGAWIVSACRDGILKVWDVDSGTEKFSLIGHTSGIRGCAISPAGDYIVSASRDGMLKIWDSQSGTCLASLTIEGRLYACAVHPDGDHIIAAGGNGLYFFRFIRG